MKTHFKKPLFALALLAGLGLLLALPTMVQAQFNFTTNNGAIIITDYTGSGGAVTIPSAINVGGTNLPVTIIGNYAFNGCTSLTSVTIPNSVTRIGVKAFESCTSLTNASIGDETFDYCTSLTNISIGNSVTSIGDDAFLSCTSLTTLTIPNSVTNIGSYAFDECYGLTSLMIPNNVISIGTNALSYCYGLTNVSIGDSVTSIGFGAFEDCTNLTSVTIPSSVTSIGGSAFDSCTSLTAINVDAANSIYSGVDGVLFDKSQTRLVEFPAGKAGGYSIPNSVTSIGYGAFADCFSLTNVSIGNSVTNIGDVAFSGTSLTSVTIPNSVISIGTEAFGLYGTGLKTVYFLGNAPSIGYYVFGIYYYSSMIVYYLPGTAGWGPWFGDRPTVLWNPQAQTGDGSFGVQNNQFGFNITGSSNLLIVVEASTDLSNPTWIPVGTNTLNTFVGTNGTSYFSDPQWTNYPNRFYRFRSP